MANVYEQRGADVYTTLPLRINNTSCLATMSAQTAEQRQVSPVDPTTELEVGAAAPSAHLDADDVGRQASEKTVESEHDHGLIDGGEKSAVPAADAKPAGPPDGGLAAWTVVAGGFVTLFCSFGFLNNFAAFQSYYFNNTLKGYSNSDIAWIGAMQTFAILSANLVMGPLFDRYGPRPLLITATFVFAFGCMMTSLADKYYQIFLAQGVVIGWSLGAAFITPVACTMQWFDKKRPAALGIVISGSSIGGVVWPIITFQLLKHVGFGWTWRALGFIGLGLLPISVLTVRMPPYAIEARKKRGPQPALALGAFKTPRYSAYIVSYCFFACAYLWRPLVLCYAYSPSLSVYTQWVCFLCSSTFPSWPPVTGSTRAYNFIRSPSSTLSHSWDDSACPSWRKRPAFGTRRLSVLRCAVWSASHAWPSTLAPVRLWPLVPMASVCLHQRIMLRRLTDMLTFFYALSQLRAVL